MVKGTPSSTSSKSRQRMSGGGGSNASTTTSSASRRRDETTMDAGSIDGTPVNNSNHETASISSSGSRVTLNGSLRRKGRAPKTPAEASTTAAADAQTPLSSRKPPETPSKDVRPDQLSILLQNTQKVLSLEDLAGLEVQISELRDIILLPVVERELATRLNMAPTRSVIIHGPRGTGKTTLMRALEQDLTRRGIHFCITDATTLLCKREGESEAKLRSTVAGALERTPSVLFIDDIDLLCEAKRYQSDQEKKIVTSLCSILDELPYDLDRRLVIIGATSRLESVDSSLKRPGRMDKEIELPIPMADHRVKILNKILTNVSHNLHPEDFDSIARAAYSFTGADLMLACREAALAALRAKRSTIDHNELAAIVRRMKPSTMREIVLEVPKVYWTDIGGMEEVKKRLVQAVVWPLRNPQAFLRMGITPPKGILMYGPPGCSKTLIGKALATESGLNFMAIKGPELFNKYVGESERAMRDIFKRAKQSSPAILFFDEIDSLAKERSDSSGGSSGGGGGGGGSDVGNRMMAQMLTELDGIESLDGVVIVAATNRPDMIDKALMRPGRLDSVIYVPLPDLETRREIFTIKTRSMPLEARARDSVLGTELARLTEGYSGAEITAVCQEAGLLALEEDMAAAEIRVDHFERALTLVRPRTTSSLIQLYEDYARQHSLGPAQEGDTGNVLQRMNNLSI